MSDPLSGRRRLRGSSVRFIAIAIAVCLSAAAAPADAQRRRGGRGGIRANRAVKTPTRSARSARPRTDAPKLRRSFSPRVRGRVNTATLGRSLRKGDVLVLDLDNTVVDTRPRTLEAARRFARSQLGLPRDVALRIERATVDDVDFDPVQTARRLGIPEAHRGAFETAWEAVFWDPRSLELDTPVHAVVRMAKEAARRGIEVRYLTGRREPYRAATLAQLKRLGMPLADESKLFLKPDRRDTPRFKRSVLARMSRVTRVIFVDDSAANLRAVSRVANVDAAQVEFPVREPGWQRVPGTRSLSVGL